MGTIEDHFADKVLAMVYGAACLSGYVEIIVSGGDKEYVERITPDSLAHGDVMNATMYTLGIINDISDKLSETIPSSEIKVSVEIHS